MLSNEQFSLLQWMQSQPSAPTMNDMERLNAPGFSRQRVEQMYQSGLLRRDLNRVSSDGRPCAAYNVSDMGRIELDTIARLKARERKENIRYVITTAIAVVALVVSIISILLQQR